MSTTEHTEATEYREHFEHIKQAKSLIHNTKWGVITPS
jgi:hypothetical protein